MRVKGLGLKVFRVQGLGMNRRDPNSPLQIIFTAIGAESRKYLLPQAKSGRLEVGLTKTPSGCKDSNNEVLGPKYYNILIVFGP